MKLAALALMVAAATAHAITNVEPWSSETITAYKLCSNLTGHPAPLGPK